MSTRLSQDERKEQLQKILKGFHTAMLVTRSPEGGMHARPLAVAEQSEADVIYFATAIESPKVKELKGDPHVNVTLQEKQRFVSITGTANVVQDRALIEKLWSDSWKIWFPGGKEDPSLCVVVVEPSEATYWDNSGLQGLKFIFEAAKAYVTGDDVKADDADDRRSAWVKL